MNTQTQQANWPGFGYAPVRGLADRLIARQLRAARKAMTRFFHERGMFEFAGRMDRIRKSRQGMLAKNQMFQRVLDEYAKLVSPHQQTPAVGVPEAAALEDRGDADVGVPDHAAEHAAVHKPDRVGADAERSVHGVEEPDAGLVIEE